MHSPTATRLTSWLDLCYYALAHSFHYPFIWLQPVTLQSNMFTHFPRPSIIMHSLNPNFKSITNFHASLTICTPAHLTSYCLHSSKTISSQSHCTYFTLNPILLLLNNVKYRFLDRWRLLLSLIDCDARALKSVVYIILLPLILFL